MQRESFSVMGNKLKVIGIIGARSGSKSVPHKNIRPLFGKPLMAWIIEAAKRSKYLDRVIVSTDSEDYARIAREFGAETLFLRPAEISGDKALDVEYVRHAIDWLRDNERYNADIAVRLMPTVPMQETGDIDGCVEALISDPEADASVVIAEARQHPFKALKIIPDGHGGNYLVSFATGKGADVNPTARQGYDKAYFRANIVATRTEVIRKYNSLAGEKVRCHIIPSERAVDIDSSIDFFLVEKLMEKMNLV